MSSEKAKSSRKRARAAADQPGAPEATTGESPADQGGRPQDGEATQTRASRAASFEMPGSGGPELPISWSFRGFLVLYILLLLSLQRAHGYFIEQYLRGLGLLNVELSSLYRTLRQLESAGLVSSTWEHGQEGPARRVYSLTDAGRWWLDGNAGILQGYRTLIDRFFGSYLQSNREPGKKDE
jgi:poly-beta-hydroxybutyrate-responsive repressor